MKKFILLLLLFNIISTIFSQNIKEKDERIPFVIVQKTPIYKGCKSNINQEKCTQDSIKAHFSKNINFTEKIGLKSGKKRIVTQFIINKDGSVTSIKTRAPHQKLILETERVTKLLPPFIAGEQNGKPVTVIYNLPILFKIENTDNNISFDNAILLSKVDKTPSLTNHPTNNNLYVLRYYFDKFISKNYGTDAILSVSKNSNLPFVNSKFKFKILIDKYGEINKTIVSEILLNTDSLTYEIKDVLLNKEVQDEALNIMQKFPKLIPGMHKEKNVNVKFEIQITFSPKIKNLKLRQKNHTPIFISKKTSYDTYPIFSNCKKKSNDKIKQCFYKKINNHIYKHLDREIFANSNVSNGKTRVLTQFIINKEGKISNVKVRCRYPELTKEFIRLINLLPNTIPAKYKNKPIEMHFGLPILVDIGKKLWIEKISDEKKQRDVEYYNKFGHY